MSEINELINKSNNLFNNKNYTEVIKTCKKILEIESNNEIANKLIGISFYNLKKYEESEKYLEKAYDNNSINNEIIRYYGLTLLEVNKLDKALSLYDNSLKKDDEFDEYNFWKYFLLLSDKCLNKNKKTAAIKCLDYYLNFYPNSSYIFDKKINILFDMKRFDQIIYSYDSLIYLEKDEEKLSKLMYDKMLYIEAKALNSYNKYFKIINETKDIEESQPLNFCIYLDESKKYYSESLNLFQENKCVDDKKLHKWYHFLSNCLLDETDDFFNKFFTLEKNNESVWYDKINSLPYTFREYALDYCNILLENNDTCYQLFNKQAELLEEHNYPKALKTYEKVLKIKKYDETAINGKLKILYYLQWYKKAYEYIKTLPSDIDGIISSIERITELLINKKKYIEAIDCYEKILECKPAQISAITSIRKIWKDADMKEAKKNSKYYMDWIDVIISREDSRYCTEKNCNEQLYHIVNGLNGHRIIGKSPENRDLIIKEYIDCDDNSTHYCPKCKKEYKYGVENFNFNMQDPVLYEYAKSLILNVKHNIYNTYYNGSDINDLQEKLYDEYLIDKREFNVFINKLEKLNYINKRIELNYY